MSVDEVAATIAPTAPLTQQRRARVIVSTFLENKAAVGGLVVMVALVLFCFVGPLVYHTDQIHTRLGMEHLAPGPGRPLGTDEVGYDQLGRLMVGGQTSLEVAFGAAAVAVIVGVCWGAAAGYFGGIVDGILMRVVDALLAIPALFLLLILATIFQPSVLMLILVVGLMAWLVPARLVRGETLSLRTREYVQAVKVVGGGGARAVVRHIVPNAIGTIIVQATFAVADSILILSGLGFLGLGVQAPATDWGNMLSGGLTFIESSQSYWWLIYPPGIAIILTCIAFNFIGDALRDAFETRLQRR